MGVRTVLRGSLAVLLWACFYLCVFVPIFWAPLASQSPYLFFFESSLDRLGWNFRCSVRTDMLMLLVGLIAGLPLAMSKMRWRDFISLGGLRSSLLLALGLGLIVVGMYRLKSDFWRIEKFRGPFYLTFLGAALVQELGFRGFLFAHLAKRPVVFVVLSSLLGALWIAAFYCQLTLIPLTSDRGLERIILAAFAGALLALARLRGASLLPLAVVNAGVTAIFLCLDVKGHAVRFDFPIALGVFAPSYLLVAYFLSQPKPNIRRATVQFASVAGAAIIPWAAALWLGDKTPPVNRDEAWRADLAFLAAEYPRRHLNFSRLISKQEFKGEIAAINQEVPKLSDAEIIIRLTKLVARLGDAHSGVTWETIKQLERRWYPFMRWASDGLILPPTGIEQLDVLASGARITKIGPYSPEELQERLAPYIPAETEQWRRYLFGLLCQRVDLMRYLDVVGADEELHLVVAKRGRAFFTY